MTDLNHKEGCVWKDAPRTASIHRVPIECVTAKELLDTNFHLREVIEHQKRELIELKAQIYDLEKEAGE
jgi:hypothetical protein